MSGSLRVVARRRRSRRARPLDVVLAGGGCLRLRDPRRFGCMLFTAERPHRHSAAGELGAEPLSSSLRRRPSRGDRAAAHRSVEGFLMDSAVVVGVGNIYANEALCGAPASIRGGRPGRVTARTLRRARRAVKETLARAIEKGGTTLRDFLSADGQTGYFRIELADLRPRRAPLPALRDPIRAARVGQRSSPSSAALPERAGAMHRAPFGTTSASRPRREPSMLEPARGPVFAPRGVPAPSPGSRRARPAHSVVRSS
jgi:formamidopyrimidine-DNA glycosylase